jgi:putative sterol carrier protein
MDIHALLRRVPDACDPEAIAPLEGVIQFEISRPVWHEVRGGAVRVHDGRAEAPDAIVAAEDELLADLYAGRANPVLAFMTGKLEVRGDVGLVKRLIAAVDRERLGSGDA